MDSFLRPANAVKSNKFLVRDKRKNFISSGKYLSQNRRYLVEYVIENPKLVSFTVALRIQNL